MQFRNTDFMTEEIKKQLHSDIIENERNNICQRGIKRKLTKNINRHRVNHERFLHDIKVKNTYSNVQINLEQEEKLAKELQKEKRDEIIELKTREQLRETNLELRDLKSKLRAAYTTKELTAQIAEKEYLKFKEKMQEKEASEVLKSALRSNIEAGKLEAEEDLKRKMEYRKDLQDQIISKYREQQNKYEDENLKDKKSLDDVVQRMHDENARELKDNMCRMKRFKEEIDAFKKGQEIWRQKEKVELEQENKRTEQFLQNKQKQLREKQIQISEALNAREKAMEEVAKKTYIDQIERKERQELLQDCIEAEVKEKEDQRNKLELQQQIQRRIDMQNVLNRQLEEQEQKIKQEELENDQYKKQFLAKIMENNKLEQLSAEKKRRKTLELRREVEQHMKERQAQRAEETRTALYIEKQDQIEEEKRRKIIDDERMRFLKEHASNLIGYLPPGVLRAEDLPRLGPEYVQYYSSKNKM